MEIESDRKKRRRRTVAERARIVADYQASGKTQSGFCRDVGISVASLSVWRRQNRENRGHGKLIEVALPSRAAVPLEIALPDCVTVRVAVGTPASWVAAIVSSLRCGA